MQKITKEDILSVTNNGRDIFKHYTKDFIEDNIPFISPKGGEAKVLQNEHGHYFYEDLTNGSTKDAFGYVQYLMGLDQVETVKKIIEDLKLSACFIPREQWTVKRDRATYFDKYANPDKVDEYLKKYNIVPLEGYTYKDIKIKSNEKQPIWGFKLNDHSIIVRNPPSRPALPILLGKMQAEELDVWLWGTDQLPEQCETILIMDDMIDAFLVNLKLNDLGIFAVGLHSLGSKLSKEQIEGLQGKCKNLLVCFGVNTWNKKSAFDISKEHALKNVNLDHVLDGKWKDLLEYFRAQPEADLFLREVENARPAQDPLITELERIELELKSSLDDDVVQQPLINYQGVPVIYKGSLNAIVGSQGSHKSRLASHIASVLCGGGTTDVFSMASDRPCHVLYIDTERSKKHELKAVIKAVRTTVGDDNFNNYCHFTSLKEISRYHRLSEIRSYVTDSRNKLEGDLVVVLDVITDAVGSFNDVEQTNQLFDYLGALSEELDLTILAVIHLNPGSDKPRGNVGTELENKSSTSIKVSSVKIKGESVVKVDFRKTRNSEIPKSAYMRVESSTGALVQMTKEEQSELSVSSQLEEFRVELVQVMQNLNIDYNQQDLLPSLQSKFGLSTNTIKGRLKSIIEKDSGSFTVQGVRYQFTSTSNSGRPTKYKLEKLDQE